MFSLKQTAEVLVQASPHKFILPYLLEYMADQHGFLTWQQIRDTANNDAIADDWARVWHYTEAVNPYVSMHAEYVPIPRPGQAATPVQPLLY